MATCPICGEDHIVSDDTESEAEMLHSILDGFDSFDGDDDDGDGYNGDHDDRDDYGDGYDDDGYSDDYGDDAEAYAVYTGIGDPDDFFGGYEISPRVRY